MSGELRDVANGGVKKDEEKPRFDLVPVRPIMGAAEVFKFGGIKYSDRNWEHGLEFSRVYRAALGHLMAWWDGENFDSEWGLLHLDHALCCVLMLSEYMHRYEQFTRFDNRPHLGDDSEGRPDSADSGSTQVAPAIGHAPGTQPSARK